MKRRNRMGPKTVPWCASEISAHLRDVLSSTRTCWNLLDRKDSSQLLIGPLIPRYSALWSKLWWGTQSNAFEKSTMFTLYCCSTCIYPNVIGLLRITHLIASYEMVPFAELCYKESCFTLQVIVKVWINGFALFVKILTRIQVRTLCKIIIPPLDHGSKPWGRGGEEQEVVTTWCKSIKEEEEEEVVVTTWCKIIMLGDARQWPFACAHYNLISLNPHPAWVVVRWP